MPPPSVATKDLPVMPGTAVALIAAYGENRKMERT